MSHIFSSIHVCVCESVCLHLLRGICALRDEKIRAFGHCATLFEIVHHSAQFTFLETLRCPEQKGFKGLHTCKVSSRTQTQVLQRHICQSNDYQKPICQKIISRFVALIIQNWWLLTYCIYWKEKLTEFEIGQDVDSEPSK